VIDDWAVLMRRRVLTAAGFAVMLAGLLPAPAFGQQGTPPAAPGQPAPAAAPARGRGAPPPVAVVGKTMAVADLMTPEGLAVFNGQWKVSGVTA